jgi:hypothetical protein
MQYDDRRVSTAPAGNPLSYPVNKGLSEAELFFVILEVRADDCEPNPVDMPHSVHEARPMLAKGRRQTPAFRD